MKDNYINWLEERASKLANENAELLRRVKLWKRAAKGYRTLERFHQSENERLQQIKKEREFNLLQDYHRAWDKYVFYRKKASAWKSIAKKRHGQCDRWRQKCITFVNSVSSDLLNR